MDTDIGAHILVLIFPHFGNPYVLDEVQELELEEQQDKVHILVGLSANVCLGLSCPGRDHILVSDILGCFIQEECLTLTGIRCKPYSGLCVC
jgi:hypothetical protein